jgi:LPXTG-motif cell wall-anchored protein
VTGGGNDQAADANADNSTPTLLLIGSAGLIVVGGWLLFGRRSRKSA